MQHEEVDPFKEVEFPEQVPAPKSKFRHIKTSARMINKSLKQIAPAAAILSLIAVSVGIFFGYPVYKNYNYTDPSEDGYVAPRSPGDVVEKVQESVVKVICDDNPNDDGYWFGSGWAIDLKPSSKAYKSVIITNHHVIEDCIDGKGTVQIENFFLKRFKAVIDVYDVENDLAKISTTGKLTPLELSQSAPWPGYWVMTFGSPDEYLGSVSVGTVMNQTPTEVLITANISNGNSGGPLVDNEGLVIGTNSWGRKGEQYNGAMSLDAMCAKILKCKYAKGKEYWDYS